MRKKIGIILILLLMMSCLVYSLYAFNIPDLTLNIGDSKIFAFDNVSKVNVTNTNIVKVIPVSSNEIIINGYKQGMTEVYIWDRGGRHHIKVYVKKNLSHVKNQIDQLLGNKNNVNLSFDNNTLFVKGEVGSKEDIKRIDKIIRTFSKKSVNLLKIKQGETGELVEGRNWKKEIDDMIDNPDIKVEIKEDSVVLRGNAKNASEIKIIVDSVTKLVGKDKKVIDLLTSKTKLFSRASHIKEAINIPGVEVKLIYNGVIVDSTIPNEAHTGFDVNFDKGDVKYNILLCGKVRSERERKEADTVAKAFNTDVVNVIELMEPVQVLIDTKVVEIAKSDTKDLNVDWGFVKVDGTDKQNITYDDAPNTGIIRFMEDLRLYPRGDVNILGPEVSQSINPVKTGNFNRLDPLMVRIQALEQNGKAKILSNPKLVTLTEQKATLHVGGQVPVEVIGQNNLQTIEWKDYGIKLEVTPSVNSDGNITVKILSEVSDLDFSNATKDGVPAIKTRTANTQVFVHDKDTIVLSGLIQSKLNENTSKIPILGDLPLIGKAFRKNQNRKSKTELILFLTPKVVKFSEKKVIPKTKAVVKVKPVKTKLFVKANKTGKRRFIKKIENRKNKIKNIFSSL